MSSVRTQYAAEPAKFAPRLLIEPEPWRQVFLRNLADFLLRRDIPRIRLTARPAQFWPDVFVDQRISRRSLAQSAGWHVLAVLSIFGITQAWVDSPLTQSAMFRNRSITYYNVSEYLPTIDTGSEPAPVERKGDPAYARQKVISLPHNPDNSRQTIVDPSNSRILRAPRALPNLVAWNAPAPVAPTDSLTRNLSRSSIPFPDLSVIAPAVNAGSRDISRLQQMPTQQAVQPAVDSSRREVASLNLPRLPSQGVVEPSVSPDAAQRKLGDLNMGAFTPTAAAPHLPVPVQRSSGAGGEGATAAPAPPQPSLAGGVAGSSGGGRLIALGLDPAPASGPIEIPGGNRSGIFAAGPEGKPGAAGTPDVVAGGKGPGGHGNGDAGPSAGAGSDIPAGIQVAGGGAPAALGAAVVAATPPPPAPPARSPTAGRIFPSLTRPSLTDLAKKTAPGAGDSAGDTRQPVDPVFGTKKYYSMMLNMPNLTSAAGTWIIRFAELNQSQDKAELTAPEATVKVDPAYPAELIRDHVEGTVTLYAVIHADGTVGDIRVINGVEHRLDENAAHALARWHFRPATKHGAAIDLEAVVQIPFRIRRVVE